MDYTTPNKGQAQQPTSHHSPTSVATISPDGVIVLDEDALQYLQQNFKSEDDPFLLIHWENDGVMEALFGVYGNLIAGLPPVPAYLNITSPE